MRFNESQNQRFNYLNKSALSGVNDIPEHGGAKRHLDCLYERYEKDGQMSNALEQRSSLDAMLLCTHNRSTDKLQLDHKLDHKTAAQLYDNQSDLGRLKANPDSRLDNSSSLVTARYAYNRFERSKDNGQTCSTTSTPITKTTIQTSQASSPSRQSSKPCLSSSKISNQRPYVMRPSVKDPADSLSQDAMPGGVSERLFMTVLMKHTAIALAIIVPLAAVSAYAQPPSSPSNQPISSQVVVASKKG